VTKKRTPLPGYSVALAAPLAERNRRAEDTPPEVIVLPKARVMAAGRCPATAIVATTPERIFELLADRRSTR